MKKQTAEIEIYDTTNRDGAQADDVNFSVEDKLRIIKELDKLGIPFIEGGWPGSNPTDVKFFEEVKKLNLANAILFAFGSTHHAKNKVHQDPNVKALLKSGTKGITIFGKTRDMDVKNGLKISLGRNLELIRDTIAYLKKKVNMVFFDAEHFFDGYKRNPKYALNCLKVAEKAGAGRIILCDTNGGSLPHEISEAVKAALKVVNVPVGIHAHNDSNCAVANSIAAVRAGATHVQGTINGLGERCGNADLTSIIPNLQLKLGLRCITDGQLKEIKKISRFVTEVANLRHFKRQPYVGDSAFAHKGGIHVAAYSLYEHTDPLIFGNTRKILGSDQAGRSNIRLIAKGLGITVLPKDDSKLKEIVNKLKELESQGFQFDAADASLELLIRESFGIQHKKFFNLIAPKVLYAQSEDGKSSWSEASVQVAVGGHIEHTAANGDGPVNALDNALRKALEKFYPKLKKMNLIDYKVRILQTGVGTKANTRVLIESGSNGLKWGTVGVSENIIEASLQALLDSYVYYLLKMKVKSKL